MPTNSEGYSLEERADLRAREFLSDAEFRTRLGCALRVGVLLTIPILSRRKNWMN